MLSGSRALEFLGNQGVTALGNLVLSRRDSLLLDVRSTVLAEEVVCLRYADLPSSSGLFPSPLLDSAQTKMRVASNNALDQRLLHPPKIPRKSSAGPSKAGSSSAYSADRGGTSVAEAGIDSPLLFFYPVGLGEEAPFSRASGRSGGKRQGAGKKPS